MKRIIPLLVLVCICSVITAQVINEPANWPNTNWSLTGSHNVNAIEADPTIITNFAFSDFDAGFTSSDNIAAESPIIDLTVAHNTGETALFLDLSYVYNIGNGLEDFVLEYWDADVNEWFVWQIVDEGTTPSAPVNLCLYPRANITSDQLNIFAFTSGQLSGFKYRISYYDNGIDGTDGIAQGGFCVESPLLYSAQPVGCPAVTNITFNNITDVSASASWYLGNNETEWEIVVQNIGSGLPTGSGTNINTNPFSIENLTASTNYEVYVRAICGTEYSDWAGPAILLTDNPTIPSITGVSCSTNNNSYIFTAEFDAFDGWTGDIANTEAIGGFWEVPGDSDSPDTGPDMAFSGQNYMNFEASGNAAMLTASAITPEIDLTTGAEGAELSFYMHAYGQGIGTLEVGISNTILGPFSNLFTWVGELQTSGSDPWTPVGINLDAYLGQTVYIEYKYTRTGNFRGDLSIDLVRVETCNSVCLPPNVSIDEVTGTSVDISWVPNGGETSYDYVLQPSGTGEPTSGWTNTNVTGFTDTTLSPETEYEVYVRSNCGSGTSEWVGPIIFTTPIISNYIIDCGNGPLNLDYCYGADGDEGDPLILTFASSDGVSPVSITFNSGYLQIGDELVVLDGNGTEILGPDDNFYGNEVNPFENAGDLSGFSYTSDGTSISFYINSNGSVSCEQGQFPFDQGINYSVTCATCTNPEAIYTVVDDCDNGSQFLIDVDITDLGDATSLTISNNVDNNTVVANALGTYQVGPFPFFTDVIITVANNQDINCVINSSEIQLIDCPPANDFCEDAIMAAVNEDGVCNILTSGTLLSATPSGISEGSCTGDPDDDVWFVFTATDDAHIITLENISFNSDELSVLHHAVYEGTCNALAEIACYEESYSTTPSLVIGNTYFIRVFSNYSEYTNITFDLCIRPDISNMIIDDTTYTPEELVTDILFVGECVEVSNIQSISGSNFSGNPNSIGYFSMNGSPGFPFDEGIVITTGDVTQISGPNSTDELDSGDEDWPGDIDLNDAVGVASENATVLEFDFVPLAQEISFNFLMASEEYSIAFPQFECQFSDAFAFLLTDSSATPVTTNLAVLPNNDPILVTNIHPENDFCPAINEEYFGEYTPYGLPPTSFDGQTVVFNAQANVIPGETYHIKLVVADSGINGETDNDFDTAVFIEAGSFDLGELDLGDDITIASGEADCFGSPILLDTGAPNLDHVWLKNNVEIVGETSSTLLVTEPDTYTALVIFSNQCFLQDDIVVEFLQLPTANQPQDLVGCSADGVTEFFLTDQDGEILGAQSSNDFTVTYHETEQNAMDNVSSLSSPYQNISDPQTVYARVEDNTTGCFSTTSFDLVFGLLPITSFPEDFDYEVCPNATVPIEISAIPENYSATDVSISWYLDGGLISGQTGLVLPVTLAGTYTVEAMFNDTGCFATTDIDVIELENCIIPQGISPGVSPGQNDTFDLSSFDVIKLEIFNRNGTLVYSKTNYTDEWFGQTNDGEELPVGTYFYTMVYEGGAKRRSAWVYINR